MAKKIKKIKPYTTYYNRMASVVARTYCPAIIPCADCGYPTIKGYCCTICGSTNPQR